MLKFLKKNSKASFVVAVFLLGCTLFYLRERSYQKQITDLHNTIAQRDKTIEIKDNLYIKKTAELSDLDSLLRTLQSESEKDKNTIAALRKEIKKKDEEILAVNRIALKWKMAYEAVVAASQETDPGEDPVDTSDDRVKVSFETEFGNMKVSGFTLTNPPIASLKLEQVRPLYLTVVVTQSKDKSWQTYVTTSEENIEVSLDVSAVNPYVMERRWYEKLSLDVGSYFDLESAGVYTTVSYPVGPLSLSGGVSGNQNGVGWYGSAGYSWYPFSR